MTAPAAATPPGADRSPEDRGIERDGVRLLVSRRDGESHHRFLELPELLDPGDLLVVNESATIPASLPARAGFGAFSLNFSTAYGPDLWLAEPRWGYGEPGPLPLDPGDRLEVAGLPGRLAARYPGIPRLGFVRVEGDLATAMRERGRPIRYGYLAREYPLSEYQTVFGRIPGSAEMPSAARPFTPRLLEALGARGIGIAPILLHAGVSSLEVGDLPSRGPALYPEPFEVSSAAVEAVRRTRHHGGRVIAVGTTVVRALESAVEGRELRPARGFTRVHVGPGRPALPLDGLLTGFHDARSTHLALLGGVIGPSVVERAYRVALENGYLWHEFGDSHLWLAH